MITAHSPVPIAQPVICQLSHSRLAGSFVYESSNTANLLPTWTPLPSSEKSSKRGPSDLDADDDIANASEVDELAFDDVIQTPVKKRKVSSYIPAQPRVQSTNASPKHAKGVSAEVTRTPNEPIDSFRPFDDATFSKAGSSGSRSVSSSSDIFESSLPDVPATESNVFAGSDLLNSAARLDISSTTQGEQSSPDAQILTSNVGVFGGASRTRNVRNLFSRQTIFSTDVSAPTPNPTFESISTSSYTLASPHPKRRRRDAQPQWESPKAAKSRVVVVPTREVDANELEVLTNASVSPIVFLRPKYAALPLDEQREAAIRWNLRWLNRVVEDQREETRSGSKGTSTREDTSNSPALGRDRRAPAAKPEMTRSQRRDLIIDGILVKEKRVRFALAEDFE